MTIEKINTDNCFNLSSYSNYPIDPHVFEPIVYKCPDCGKEVTFSEKDFQKHSGKNFTNLDKDISELMDNFVAKNNLDLSSFLDFNCPTCKKATRIYFSDGYGGKHGEYGIKIHFGLKIK